MEDNKEMQSIPRLELLGVEDIMAMTGVSRYTVTRWLQDPSCPTRPRRKNSPYKIEKEAFMSWLRSGQQ